MKVTKSSFKLAVKEEIITKEQSEKLFSFLESQPSTATTFNLTNVLYYMGGLIAIGAMSLFITIGWEVFGGWGILIVSLLYAVFGLKLASVFRRKGYHIPAGICATFVVALAPLAIYGFQVGMGWWPEGSVYRDYHRYIKWHWIFLELGTLAVGAVIIWFYRYRFLLMPIAVTLWYMSMDVAVMIAGSDAYDFSLRSQVSLWFGLVMTLVAFWVDVRSRKSDDYAFWLYIFGVLTFWGGMTSQESHDELSKFIYCCINLGLIGIGVVLVRRVFVVFGAIGCTTYIGHLAWEVFEDSLLFPIALTAIGLGIVLLGIVWQKNEEKITKKVRGVLPTQLSELLEERS